MRTKLVPVTKKQVVDTCQLLRQDRVCVCVFQLFTHFGLDKVAYLIMESFLELQVKRDK